MRPTAFGWSMSIVDRLFSNPVAVPTPVGDDAIAAAVAAVFSAPVGRVQQGRQAERLVNRGATFPEVNEEPRTVAEEQRSSVAARWRLKSKVVKFLRDGEEGRGPAVCGCGYGACTWTNETVEDPVTGAVSVRRIGTPLETVRLHRKESGAASVSNVFRCDSPWLCPSCAPARAKRRAERNKEVVERAYALGGMIAFVTLTVSHSIKMPLADVKAMLSTASRKARQGRRWQDIANEGGILGVVQGVEVLHNKRTGWHYHAHLIIPAIPDGATEKAQAAKLRKAARSMVARYMEEVGKLGGVALKVGQDVQVVGSNDEDRERIADYAAKGSAAWEAAGGLKDARSRDSRTPWDLVVLASAGDDEAARMFREYAEVLPGTRSCVVSPKLAEKLFMQADADDDAPGDALEEGDGLVGELSTPVWSRLLSGGVAWRVLQAVEDGQEWGDVEALAFRLKHEVEGFKAREAERRRPIYDPDLRELVAAARAGKYWSRSPAAAIVAAIDRQRRYAESRGYQFREPPLKRVMELVAA